MTPQKTNELHTFDIGYIKGRCGIIANLDNSPQRPNDTEIYN